MALIFFENDLVAQSSEAYQQNKGLGKTSKTR
jgi:hypothetical protein